MRTGHALRRPAIFTPALSFPRMLARIVILLGISLWSTLPSLGAERAWRLDRMSGDVTVTDGTGKPYAIGPGFVVRPGDRVVTGANGRALLSRGADSIVMSLNAAIEIPLTEKEGETPTVVQRQGSATFDVEKLGVPRFIVETPQLGAVVKGTNFTVEVQEAQTAVSVAEGVVQVQDYASGDMADIRSRQSARSAAPGSSGLALDGDGPLPMIRRNPPRQPTVATLAVAQATVPSSPPALSKPALPPAPAIEPPPAPVRMQTVNYFLTKAGTPEVFLTLVILGSITTGIVVWLALLLWGVLRRRNEGVRRIPRPEP